LRKGKGKGAKAERNFETTMGIKGVKGKSRWKGKKRLQSSNAKKNGDAEKRLKEESKKGGAAALVFEVLNLWTERTNSSLKRKMAGGGKQ